MKYCSLFLCILFVFQLSAQKKTIEYAVHNKKYLLGNNFYEFKDLEPHFQTFEDTRIIWKKYNERRKSGNFFAGLGAGLFLLSAVQRPPTEDMYCDLFCINESKALTFVGGLFSASIGMGLHIGKAKFKIRLIDAYNAHSEEDLGRTEPQMDLEFGVSSNGIGIRLSF